MMMPMTPTVAPIFRLFSVPDGRLDEVDASFSRHL
jgi:hypothetical protein